jgi:NitT/TauT family transport system ATP-binding protein
VVADISIPLKRPRSVSDLQRDPGYHELYAEVWAKLEEGMTGMNAQSTSLA